MNKFIHLSFVICSLVILLTTGCARTVTSYVTYGNEMVVDVTLRGNMDTSANRYFLVLARTPGYRVPLPRPDNIDFEMIEPGTIPRSGATFEADYYTNFYASWEGYCIVDVNLGGYSLVKGPFKLGGLITHEVIASPGAIATKLTFNFEMSRIFGAAVPDTIYFDLVTVPRLDDDPAALRLPADHLAATDAYIAKIAGSTITVVDESNPALDAALDITECTVTIQ